MNKQCTAGDRGTGRYLDPNFSAIKVVLPCICPVAVRWILPPLEVGQKYRKCDLYRYSQPFSASGRSSWRALLQGHRQLGSFLTDLGHFALRSTR